MLFTRAEDRATPEGDPSDERGFAGRRQSMMTPPFLFATRAAVPENQRDKLTPGHAAN